MSAAAHDAGPDTGGRRDEGGTRLWLAGRVLLVVAGLAFVVTGWFALWPVANPGVQDCGAPLRFAMEGDDVRVRPLDPDTPPELLVYADQPTCRARTQERLGWAARAFAVTVVAGLAGAALGLVDDRLALRRAPPFETYLRERPAEVPGRVWDRPLVPAADLGRRLPDVEGRDVGVLLGAGVVAVVGLALVGGWSATWGLVSSPSVGPLVLLVLTVPAGWVLTAWERDALGGGAAPDPAGGAVGSDGGWASLVAGRGLLAAMASSFAAAVLPAFGGAGVEAHRRVEAGAPRGRALVEVGAMVLGAAAVHGVLLAVAVAVVTVRGAPGADLPAGGGWVTVGAAVVVLVGLGTAPYRWRQLVVRPDRASLGLLRSWAARPAAVAVPAACAVAVALLPAVALVAAVAAVGGSARVDVVVAVALLAAVAVPIAPTPAGVGLVEAVVALGLWRAGLPAPQGAAAVIVFRAVTLWLPIPAGWVAYRRLACSATA